MKGRCFRLAVAWLVAACLLPAAKPALCAKKEPVRIAVVAGSNLGAGDERPLRYAEDDATKMSRVLTEVAGFDRERVFAVLGHDRSALLDAMAKADRMVRDLAREPGRKVLLLFYFSGHSDGLGLEFGDDMVEFSEVKDWLKKSPATVRMAVVDACHSGGFAEVKGGRPGPSFKLDLGNNMGTEGMAVITSSAAGEKSQESDDVGGSYFTHYFVSGLYGAADRNGDRRITLQEVYRHAYEQTISNTLKTIIGPQHPTYQYDLGGKGDLVLSMISEKTASILFPTDAEGSFYVFAAGTGNLMAELVKKAGEEKHLIVAAGDYVVSRRKGETLESLRLDAAEGESVPVDPALFSSEQALVAWPRGKRKTGATASLTMFYSLSGWVMKDMGPVHGFGLGLSEEFGPVTTLFGLSYGQAQVNDSGLRYDYRTIGVEIAPMWRFESYGFNLLGGLVAGSRLMMQDAGPGGDHMAVTGLAGLIGGVDLKLANSTSVLLTWEVDADLFELNGGATVQLSPRAKLGMGYRF